MKDPLEYKTLDDSLVECEELVLSLVVNFYTNKYFSDIIICSPVFQKISFKSVLNRYRSIDSIYISLFIHCSLDFRQVDDFEQY